MNEQRKERTMKTYKVASIESNAIADVSASSAKKAAAIFLGIDNPVRMMCHLGGIGERVYGNASGIRATKSASVFMPDETIPARYINRA
jgi:hypothetical protein